MGDPTEFEKLDAALKVVEGQIKNVEKDIASVEARLQNLYGVLDDQEQFEAHWSGLPGYTKEEFDNSIPAYRKDLRKQLGDEKQALRNKEQALRDEKQALRKKEQALRDEKQALRKKEQALRDKEQALRNKEKLLLEKDADLRKARSGSGSSGDENTYGLRESFSKKARKALLNDGINFLGHHLKREELVRTPLQKVCCYWISTGNRQDLFITASRCCSGGRGSEGVLHGDA